VRWFQPIFVLMVLLCVLSCTSAAEGFCEAARLCDDPDADLDPVGESDDSPNVCVKTQEGRLQVLRANEEAECKAEADALETYFRCVSAKAAEGEECAGLRSGSNNECQQELTALADAQQESDNKCEIEGE
jgi:hypothetical protein